MVVSTSPDTSRFRIASFSLFEKIQGRLSEDMIPNQLGLSCDARGIVGRPNCGQLSRWLASLLDGRMILSNTFAFCGVRTSSTHYLRPANRSELLPLETLACCSGCQA